MWPHPQFPADLVIFTEEVLYGKLQFLCSLFYFTMGKIISERPRELELIGSKGGGEGSLSEDSALYAFRTVHIVTFYLY